MKRKPDWLPFSVQIFCEMARWEGWFYLLRRLFDGSAMPAISSAVFWRSASIRLCAICPLQGALALRRARKRRKTMPSIFFNLSEKLRLIYQPPIS